VVRINPPPLGKLLPRHAEASVTEALTDTRVVLVNGARQSGKSTLVGVVAEGRAAQWRNVDNAITRQAAIADPVGFVDSAELMVIDEIRGAGTPSPPPLIVESPAAPKAPQTR
jgi:uncharacterized protein